MSQFTSVLIDAPSSSFTERFEWIVSKLSKEEVRIMCSLMWAAWFCRNKRVLEEEWVNAPMVASRFVQQVLDYDTYVNGVLMPRGLAGAVVLGWSSPVAGCIKVNFDAHLGPDGEIGLGVVFRNHEGGIVAAGVKRVAAAWSAVLAESAATRYAMEVARRLGYGQLWLEGDALMVINAVNKQEDGLCPHFRIINDIVRMAREFNSFSISHVKRAGNTVAHLLARWEVPCNSEHVWLHSFPQSVCTLAALDLL